jgi:hypothetical protein
MIILSNNMTVSYLEASGHALPRVVGGPNSKEDLP